VKNIYLIGMMGSGKTSTARELAKLHRNFSAVDFDELIQKETGKTISQIFKEHGQDAFREFEGKVLDKVVESSSPVIASTGGGIVITPRYVELMQSHGTLIYLKTSFPVLWERVKHSKARPLLQTDSPEETFLSIFKDRTPIYETIANYIVETDGKTPAEVAKEISERFFK